MDPNFIGEDFFAQTAKTEEKVLTKARDFFRDSLWVVCALVCILMPFLSSWVETGFQNPFTPDKIVSAVSMFICSMCMYLVMIGPGETSEQKLLPYDLTKRKWLEASERVQSSKDIAAFHLYCKQQSIERAVSRQKHHVFRAGIEWEAYLSKFANLGIRALLKCRGKELTTSQFFCVLKANNARKIREIHSELILGSENEFSETDIGVKNRSYRQKKISGKVIMLLTTTVAVNSLLFTTSPDVVGYAALIQALSRILSMALAAISGFMTGTGQVRWEISMFEQKTLFINAFYEQKSTD